MWRSVRTAGGFCLIVLGAIGTLMPVVPGVPLILAGVALVGTDHPWIRAAVSRWKPGPGNHDRSPSAA
jgi:hypothetical protein